MVLLLYSTFQNRPSLHSLSILSEVDKIPNSLDSSLDAIAVFLKTEQTV
uniref:Uncharacterized protein n=1 Tax=Anguilla anguilla TaxID=7936 RepID=A0A0E9WGY9_ANGAN